MKKTITGIAVGITALGGVAAPEAIEYSKEYSKNQVIEFVQTRGKDWRKKRAEILSKVYVPKENIVLGERKFNYKGYKVTILEKTTKDDLLKVVVRAEKNGVSRRFKPFYYKNPPISNKTCTGPTEDLVCEYDFDAEATLKEIITQTLDSVWDNEGERQ